MVYVVTPVWLILLSTDGQRCNKNSSMLRDSIFRVNIASASPTPINKTVSQEGNFFLTRLSHQSNKHLLSFSEAWHLKTWSYLLLYTKNCRNIRGSPLPQHIKAVTKVALDFYNAIKYAPKTEK